jgi:hypothetical protein
MYVIMFAVNKKERKKKEKQRVGGGGGTKSYDGDKAWSYSNHSLFSGNKAILGIKDRSYLIFKF